MTLTSSFTLPAAPSAFAQRGMVLPVTLVLILLLTLLGTAAMRNSSLQEHLAHNQREQVLAFNAAEAARLAAIAKIEEMERRNEFNTSTENHWQGEVSGYPQTASSRAPEYRFSKIDVSGGPGNIAELGAQESQYVLRIESTGFGLSLDKNNQPISRFTLETVYVIE